MIQFRRLVLKNFLSYRGKQVVPLYKQGVVRIEGINKDDPGANSNMAGKSTIAEGLLWCLFGKTLRGLKHEAVINRKARKNCSATTLFNAAGKEYRVVRYRNHKSHQNKLLLFRGDKELQFRHEADTQAKLEQVLGCDYPAFVNSTVFGGFDGARKQFALLTDKEQKRVLDSFLHFELFELAHKRTKKQVQKLERHLHEFQLDLEKQRGEWKRLREKVSTLEGSAKTFRARDEEEIRKLRKKLKHLEIPKVTVTERLVESAEKKLSSLVSSLGEATSKRHLILRTLKKLKKDVRRRERLQGKSCPYCGGEITAETLQSFARHVRKDKEQFKGKLRLVTRRLAETEKEVLWRRAKLKRLTQQRQRECTQQDRAKQQVRGLREKLTDLTSSNSPDPFLLDLEEANRDYARAFQRLLVKEYCEQQLKQQLKDLAFWEVGFGNRGVKTLIMKQLLPAMNQKLKEYSREVFQTDVELEFRLNKKTKRGEDRELLHLHYQSRVNSPSYVGESSGGRRRVDICVLLVFCWLARVSNLLLVDELLDGLDDAGRESVLAILARQRGTVLVISHQRELKSKIGKVWTVTKKHGASTLECAA